MRLYDDFLTWVIVFALVASLAWARVVQADEPCQTLLPKCTSALSACDALIVEKDAQAVVLRDSAKQWKKLSENPGLKTPLPVWTMAAGAVGGAVGALAGKGSMAAGGAVGAALGAIIGLLGE